MSFEWQTEEDYNWDEVETTPEPSAPKPKRWPWVMVIGVLLVGTAVFLLYRQLNERIETATEDVETDLASSYAVLQQATVAQDENLFNSLLSGREPEWAEAQAANLRGGMLFDRPGFSLTWQPGLAETAVISQTLSPDLTAAELTTLQTYSLDIGNGLTQTISLERVDVYRLGEDRWLYAPPEQVFWGVRRRLEGQLLSVRYPARDEKIVHRLAADLEAKLVQVCNTPGLTCPPEARVRVIFSPDPQSLAEATFMGALTRQAQGDIWTGGQAIRLPTPTLVGLPQNEVGYQTILRGYAAQLLTLAVNDLIGWECCDNAPFYRAAMTRQLYELGVLTWPLEDTAVSLPNDLTLSAAANAWTLPFPENPTAFMETPLPYLVVDFLVTERHLPPSQLLVSLAGTDAVLFIDWLMSQVGPAETEAQLSQTFRQFLQQWQAEPAASAEPEAGLTLLCQDNQQNSVGIYYYDFSLEAPLLFSEVATQETFFAGLPGGDGLAVVSESGGREAETYLLYNNETRIDIDWSGVADLGSSHPVAVPTMTDPTGRYLLWIVAPGYSTNIYHALTDLTVCQAGETCPAIPIGGYPVWSPTADQLVTLTLTTPWWNEGWSDGLMLLYDELGGTAVNSPGFGSSIFWRDETQFGYLLQLQSNLQQIVLADNNLERPEIIIDNNDLRALIPEGEERPSNLRFQFVQSLPGNPDLYLIFAGAWQSEDQPGYLLLYDHDAGAVVQVSELPPVSPSEGNGVRLSPDGRFLLVALAEREGDGTQLLLQNTNGQQLFSYRVLGKTLYPHHFYASWSPDGDWLAMPELGYIRLWHKGADEQLLSFAHLNCTNVAWVDRMKP